MKRKVRYILLVVVFFVAAVLLSGCGKKMPKSPPKQQVQDAVAAVLLPFVSLDSIELETISTGPESVKVNFKIIISPKENLYIVDREVEGTPKVTLLKVVQTAGTKFSFYGFLDAVRMMDRWTLGPPDIQADSSKFGKPRGAFDAQSYITGSNEATAAIKQQAVNAELQEQAEKAASEQQKRERIAREEQRAREKKAQEEHLEQARMTAEEQRQKENEQRQKEEEEAHQKLILATAPGTRYIGTITSGDKIQRLWFVFTEQEGTMIRAEASNPDKSSKMNSPIAPAPRRGATERARTTVEPRGGSSLAPQAQEKQTFVGELVFDPQSEKGRSDIFYTIVLSPVATQDLPYEVWNFYRNEGSLKLLLTDTGLEGEAKMGWGNIYTIHLKRAK
jgi:hypothetical protein